MVRRVRHLTPVGESLADNKTAPPPVFSFAGVYKGTYAGADTGTFKVTLAADGTISGDGASSLDDSEQFQVIGQVAEGGSVSLNSSGRAGSATFSGTVTSKGVLAGTWSDGDEGGGTFVGQKQ
ncbi:MAG: hypothetical protein V4693_22005 [Pseudomonadota bacterium]